VHFTYNTKETWEQQAHEKGRDKNAQIPEETGSQLNVGIQIQASQQANQPDPGVHSFKLSTRRGKRMDARCSRGAENPPANPLNFKLTHMLGCLRTIIITMVPMITLMMKLPVQTMMKFWFFLHSFSFLFSSYPVCQIVNGYQGRGGTLLQLLQPETSSEIALPFWAAAGFYSVFTLFLGHNMQMELILLKVYVGLHNFKPERK